MQARQKAGDDVLAVLQEERRIDSSSSAGRAAG